MAFLMFSIVQLHILSKHKKALSNTLKVTYVVCIFLGFCSHTSVHVRKIIVAALLVTCTGPEQGCVFSRCRAEKSTTGTSGHPGQVDFSSGQVTLFSFIILTSTPRDQVSLFQGLAGIQIFLKPQDGFSRRIYDSVYLFKSAKMDQMFLVVTVYFTFICHFMLFLGRQQNTSFPCCSVEKSWYQSGFHLNVKIKLALPLVLHFQVSCIVTEATILLPCPIRSR